MIRHELPLYATLALCAGPILFLRGFRDLRTRRLIQNTPTARIRSMAMGLVEINGSVHERSLVQAPFSGRECAYWEVDISIRSRRNAWSVVHRRNSGNPFFVNDDTGVAMVYPKGSECRVPPGREEECHALSLPAVYGDYLAKHAPRMRCLWMLSRMRFRERTLEEGERVYILGSAEPRAQSRAVANPALAVESEDALVPWIEPEQRATGTDGHAASLAPDLRATVTSGGASRGGFAVHTFAAQRPDQTAAALPLRGPGRARAMHSRIAAIIRKGHNEPTFIISCHSETALSTSFLISMFGKLLGGPLLTVFGVGYWLFAIAARQGLK